MPESQILLPEWILYVGAGMFLAIVFLIIAFVFYWWNNKRFIPEGALLKQARKTNTPIIYLWAMNGYKQIMLLKKDKKGDPILSIDKSTLEGIKFDPRIQSGYVPDNFTLGGLKEFNYSTAIPLPLSHKNVLALHGIVDYTRKNHPTLNALPDWLVLELAHTNKSDLPHDCQNVVEDFEIDSLLPLTQTEQDSLLQITYNNFKDKEQREPTDNELETEYNILLKQAIKIHRTSQLVEEIKTLQSEITTLPIPKHRFFSWDWAFRNISIAFSSIDFRTMMQLFEQIAHLKEEQKKNQLALYAFAALVVMIGGAVAYAIISSMSVK